MWRPGGRLKLRDAPRPSGNRKRLPLPQTVSHEDQHQRHDSRQPASAHPRVFRAAVPQHPAAAGVQYRRHDGHRLYIAAIGASCSFYSLIINFSWTLNGGHGIVVALAATSDPTVIANAVMSLHVNFVFFPALGIPLCLRAAMQSMGHKIAPLFSSSLELVIKVASSLWVIPVHGYLTASFTEPVIWLACAVLLACIFLAHPFVGTSTTK